MVLQCQQTTILSFGRIWDVLAKMASGLIHEQLQRCDSNGKNVVTIILEGPYTHMPKQLVIAEKTKKLYWCDREEMRVMKFDLDRQNVETVVKNGDVEIEEHSRDHMRWCVSIHVDKNVVCIYWTQDALRKAEKSR
jgi:hypothetical protein